MKVSEWCENNGGIFVKMTKQEALALIQSLSTQLLYDNPNYNRQESVLEDGRYFSIAVSDDFKS